MFLYSNIIETIGKTPIIQLNKVCSTSNQVFAKMEHLNPGGSIKDRTALKIIQLAYESNQITQDTQVIEMTSGNMGSGLAIVCGYFGNHLTVVMSRGNSPERVTMLRNLGANVLLVDQVDGVPGNVTGKDIEKAIQIAHNYALDTKGYYVDQFNNVNSILAHYDGTGKEIWKQLKGNVDAFVTTVGTGSTFIGIAKYLKYKNNQIKCYVVEPSGAEILAGKPIVKPRHLLQGAGYGLIPHFWESSLADGYLAVTDQEAKIMKARLGEEEGLYVGYTAAANVCASIKLSESGLLGSAPKIVTILCDTGLKYS